MRPGYADPVLDAQAAFRALMEAMARPGRLQRIAPWPDVPPGLHQASAGVLLALADAETTLWTDADSEAKAWLGFHTGAHFTTLPGEADILLAVGRPPALDTLQRGTDEAPQAGAMLLVQVVELAAEEGWRLTGPGIEAWHPLRVEGLPADFAAQWRGNRATFPCGVDLVLTAGGTLAVLARTTAIEEVS